MALTPEQIDRLIQQADGLAPKEGSIFRALVKLTEAAVRKECAAELAALRTERDHMEMAADAEARRVDELTALRKQDDALILQLVEALCECAEDSQEQLDRMEAARLRDYKPNAIAWQEDTIAKAGAAIVAGRARLESKP